MYWRCSNPVIMTSNYKYCTKLILFLSLSLSLSRNNNIAIHPWHDGKHRKRKNTTGKETFREQNVDIECGPTLMGQWNRKICLDIEPWMFLVFKKNGGMINESSVGIRWKKMIQGRGLQFKERSFVIEPFHGRLFHVYPLTHISLSSSSYLVTFSLSQ